VKYRLQSECHSKAQEILIAVPHAWTCCWHMGRGLRLGLTAVESPQIVEIFLNVVWLLLAGLLYGLWRRGASRSGASTTMQLVALAMLVVILFPVISVTDDLQAAQNPAETDCCQRRMHGGSQPHGITPAVATPPPAVLAGQPFGVVGLVILPGPPAPSIANPALAPIQNRPPPTA
jgi:hypothetical protein